MAVAAVTFYGMNLRTVQVPTTTVEGNIPDPVTDDEFRENDAAALQKAIERLTDALKEVLAGYPPAEQGPGTGAQPPE